MTSLQNAIPLLLFLIISFLAFYFIETVILFVLNWFIRRHWEWVVDKLLRTIVHHRILIRMLAFGSIALIAVLLFIFTPLADLLIAGTQALQLLALVLVMTMVLIYLIGRRTLSEVVIERRIHLYIFVVLSLLSFTGIMTLAKQGYAAYADTINRAFVTPIVSGIEQKYEKKVEDRLLMYFRDKVKNGECEYYDYAEKGGTGTTQFVFVKTDPTLAERNLALQEAEKTLAGKRCSHQTVFLLTPEGKWYEVLEQNL